MPSTVHTRPSFSDERGPGTFTSLGALPRRRLPAHKQPVFHLHHDEHDDGDENPPPDTIPFPRSSSPPSPVTTHPQHLPRGSSSTILLSNGKPLKSSLKSSSSTPSIADASTQNSRIHLRARSEPSTPAIPHKNVHFPDPERDLATICIFNRSGRPAALSNPAFNGEDTETDGEDPPLDRFPFPASSSSTLPYEIDPTKSSSIPSPHASPLSNLFLESLLYCPSSPHPPSAVKPHLTGSILVRNIAFEKHVAVRFTLDDWQTVSEVSAHYVDSLSSLPSKFPQPPPDTPRTTVGDLFGPIPQAQGWDRFEFTIRLEDYAYALTTRVLWLAARYQVNASYPLDGTRVSGPGGEWWDNNGGTNYRVSFRPAVLANARPRRETTPEPMVSPLAATSPPSTYREHALGLFVPNGKFKTTLPSDSKILLPLRTGKLNLSNYAAPPKVHSASVPPARAAPPTILITEPKTGVTLPAAPHQGHSHDEDSSSPASSTLSTPSVSPVMVPHVIIGGHPATTSSGEHEDASHPGHVKNWEWTAPKKRLSPPPQQRRTPSPTHSSTPMQIQNDNILPSNFTRLSPSSSSSPPSFSGQSVANDPLYKAFVTQWCFAQGPSPAHAYSGDGVLA